MLASLGSTGCAPEPGPPASAEMGEPLPGLTPDERRRFQTGRALFARIFTPEEGLGPRFNENSCSACHTVPVDGGTGETAVTKATRHTGTDRCDLLTPEGGENIRIQVTPEAREAGATPSPAPEEAEHRARFTIPFTFGLGLMDAVPLATLEALADPEDLDGDGISGRVGANRTGRPARFGRKADVASLADFVDGALRLEMGLTTPAFPDESMAGAVPPVPPGVDPAPEPEVDPASFQALVDFLRFLAPPEPTTPTDDPEVIRGRRLFDTLGCTGCHVPELRAGDHESSAIAGRSIALFSDLLLHDLGPGLAGTCGPGASTEEYRTEPLMGLRYREAYLHDGRAGRVRDAILQHGGEATAARAAFAGLDRVAQEAVLRYLNTI
mgnify:CR=1 FL=1